MSDTPRTDELAKRDFISDGVWIRHARELERENAALRAALEEVLPSLKGDLAVSIAFDDPRNMHEYTRVYQRVCEVLGKTP